MNKLDALIRQRAVTRREVAKERVSQIMIDAERWSVEISLIGSLASDDFAIHSDIDLLVHGSIDATRRAMVERLVAKRLRGTEIPYDLIFASDVSPDKVQELLHGRV